MNSNALILKILFHLPLIGYFYLNWPDQEKWPVQIKENLKKQILCKSRHLRRMMKDIERKERKVAQIKQDLIPLITKYRNM